jgi:hypothetical protein
MTVGFHEAAQQQLLDESIMNSYEDIIPSTYLHLVPLLLRLSCQRLTYSLLPSLLLQPRDRDNSIFISINLLQ